MKKHAFYWLALGLLFIVGCQKELSFELGNTPSKGSLQSDVTGDCLPKTVNGIYVAASPLVPVTNTITVQVNVARTGTYVVNTDTINGYFFRATGTFTTLGANNVTLRGIGTPFTDGIDNFVVRYDTTLCDIAVTVLPVGSGPAAFTLTGAPGSCSSANVAGAYAVGVPLAASNTVTLNVNVITAGTYNVTAGPFQGMTFTGTGSLAMGAQTIVLIGTPASIPTTAGANTVPVTAGGTTCSFVVNVVSPAVYTINCPGVMVNGTYQAGTPLGASNTITIPITVMTAGPYSITSSINGMTFSNSGTLTLATTTITLNPTLPGTPAMSGTFSLLVGTPSCSIPIICTAGPVIDWSFMIGTTIYQGSTDQVDFDNTTLPPFTLLDYFGLNATPEDINLTMLDLTGGILALETYRTDVVGFANTGYFSFTGPSLDLEATDPTTTPGVNITITISSHNTTTRTVIGTFQGTAHDYISNTNKTITSGNFKAVY
jgi:hypothetical protein